MAIFEIWVAAVTGGQKTRTRLARRSVLAINRWKNIPDEGILDVQSIRKHVQLQSAHVVAMDPDLTNREVSGDARVSDEGSSRSPDMLRELGGECGGRRPEQGDCRIANKHGD